VLFGVIDAPIDQSQTHLAGVAADSIGSYPKDC